MSDLEWQTVCCVGDSISDGYFDDQAVGWFGRLSQRLAKDHLTSFGFNNLSMSGDRSFDTLHRICSEALTRRGDVLFIAGGVNDTIRWHSPESQMDMSMDLRKEVWFNILKLSKENFNKIYVIGMLPVIESRFPQAGIFDNPLYHHNADIKNYNVKISEWCNEFDIQFIDIFDLFPIDDLDNYYHDASHPNGKGHAMVEEYVFSKVKESLLS